MKKQYLFITSLLLSTPSLANPVLSGGDTTTTKSGSHAFSQPATNLSLMKRIDFSVGNSFFRNPWVQAPASTDARDGLGPLFNTNGCQNCHIKDGRGHLPLTADDNLVSALIRLSIPATTKAEREKLLQWANIPEPTYGHQFQDFSVPDTKAEGNATLRFETHQVTFNDGYKVNLRKPIVELNNLHYGELHPNTQVSLRVAPPMIGLGLLESISEADIANIARQQPLKYPMISGKMNRVWDMTKQKTVLGRFGWKAGQPTLKQQNAAAFNGDIGLTSALFPHENCSPQQKICQQLPSGGSPELSENILNFVEFYTQHLAVPKRRNIEDPQVLKGEKLFHAAQCDACHVPSFKTIRRDGLPALSEQQIYPYTDLLLHDMGEALADKHGEFLAQGNEWRTPPLWGLGYTYEVNGHTEYLHDGRARNALEAILWHGGEAEASKNTVLTFNQNQRNALIAFIDSL